MKTSRIFTDAELRVMAERERGNKSDKTGLFSARVKPKILELFEWFEKKTELKRILEGK